MCETRAGSGKVGDGEAPAPVSVEWEQKGGQRQGIDGAATDQVLLVARSLWHLPHLMLSFPSPCLTMCAKIVFDHFLFLERAAISPFRWFQKLCSLSMHLGWWFCTDFERSSVVVPPCLFLLSFVLTWTISKGKVILLPASISGGRYWMLSSVPVISYLSVGNLPCLYFSFHI